MDANPTANYTTVMDININYVWELLKEFDSWIKWWPMYLSMSAFKMNENGERVPLKESEVPKDGGYYREFVTLEGTKYQEFLKVIDANQPHTLCYDFVKVEPSKPEIESITSKIILEKLSDKQTKVNWSSWTKLSAGTDPKALEGIVSVQTKAYTRGIKSATQYLVMASVWKEGLHILQERVMSMTKALLVGQNPVWGYVEQFPGPNGKPFPKFVRGLPTSEALPPKKVGKMLGRFLEVGYLQAAELVFERTADLPPGTDLYKLAAKQVVDTYGKPNFQEITDYLFKHAAEDTEFCQQSLQGCNPLQIQRITSIDQVPEGMRHLKAQEKSIQELITEKRLFLNDYKELVHLKRANDMYFYAPYVLMFKEIVDGKSRLNVLAIQLKREAGAPVYTPNGPHPLRYRMARLFAAVADNQVHEFRYHLGLSHLGMEPVIIAIHNGLPEKHAIRELLRPHLEETIGINFLARQTLIAPIGAFTNHTFAVGTAQGVELASDAWRDYHFYDFSFPNDLKRRGFSECGKEDGLEDYHYRDDAAKLWKVIGTYTEDFVKHNYKDDSAVQNDKDIQTWAVEMSSKDKAAIPGFRSEIKTRDELSLILQIIIWNGSALHSFLNFPQWPYLGYIPNRPNGLYLDMPAEDGKDITPEFLKQALLPKFATAFQIAFSWLLSLPSETNLLDLAEREGKAHEYAERFHKNLRELTKDINKRNDELRKEGKNPYIFLLPENVAASVDI